MPAPRQFRAQAVDAPPDLLLARRLLQQAQRHLASAAVEGVDRDSRFGMLYDAARKAADATMRVAGRRVTQGPGHHVLFIAEAKRLLGPDTAQVWVQVEAARSIRNDMEYRAREVSGSELAGFRAAAEEAVAAAQEHLNSAKQASSS
jgi:hypothetical protein